MQHRVERNERSKAYAKERGITRNSIIDNLLEQDYVRKKSLHNPIVTIDEVVLDPTDGDFSITVNGGKEHWWIGDEEVILIADYIEEKLKNLSE